MSTENESSKPTMRPVFRFLAGFFGVLFILAGCFSVSFALIFWSETLRLRRQPHTDWGFALAMVRRWFYFVALGVAADERPVTPTIISR
jgi:hypothetical protein